MAIALNEQYGATLDDYNDPSIQVLHKCNDELPEELLPKLNKIAFRENPISQFGERLEYPNFGVIKRRFKQIEVDIHDTIEAVSHRMETTTHLFNHLFGLSLSHQRNFRL